MHEYSIVASLVDQVTKIAEIHHGAVRRVHVRIGALSGVETTLLQTAYDTFRERTACERADLVVHGAQPVWQCRTCLTAITAGGPLHCPSCGAPGRLVSGDEIVLERVEMEVE